MKKEPRFGSTAQTLNRNTKIISMGANAGTAYLGCMFSGWFLPKKSGDRLKSKIISKRVSKIVQQMGELKGSVMKVGQLLGVMGFYIGLPPEVADMLCFLEENSYTLEWSEMRKILERELTSRKLSKLEIDPHPIASASIGQVYRAIIKDTKKHVVIKIQYPEVAQSLQSDIASIKKMLMLSKLLPKGLNIDPILNEVYRLFKYESDYKHELDSMMIFRNSLKKDPRYIIPRPFPAFSTNKILTMGYVDGLSLRDEKVLALSQEDRNKIALMAIELFLNELFSWNLMQTDPNFGNYKIILKGDSLKMALLDFGATLSFSSSFISNYRQMAKAAFYRNSDDMLECIKQLDFMPANTSDTIKNRFIDLCYKVMEPFGSDISGKNRAFFNERGEYLFRNSDLPKRLIKDVEKASMTAYFRLPPPEVLFLHRKLAGLYIFLGHIGAELQLCDLFEQKLMKLKQ